MAVAGLVGVGPHRASEGVLEVAVEGVGVGSRQCMRSGTETALGSRLTGEKPLERSMAELDGYAGKAGGLSAGSMAEAPMEEALVEWW